MILNDSDDDLEYLITLNSYVSPSQHLRSLYSSLFWVSTFDQMEQISSVESLVIQGGVGRRDKPFKLSNLPCLKTLLIGCNAFGSCPSFLFESRNDWIDNKSDLPQLQSITLGSQACCAPILPRGQRNNPMIMKGSGFHENDDSDLPSLVQISGQFNFTYVSPITLESMTDSCMGCRYSKTHQRRNSYGGVILVYWRIVLFRWYW